MVEESMPGIIGVLNKFYKRKLNLIVKRTLWFVSLYTTSFKSIQYILFIFLSLPDIVKDYGRFFIF